MVIPDTLRRRAGKYNKVLSEAKSREPIIRGMIDFAGGSLT